ncbi:MAG: carboxypeptidase-like regulatory domain-containing protein, partial [Mucilaginibacter sp.]
MKKNLFNINLRHKSKKAALLFVALLSAAVPAAKAVARPHYAANAEQQAIIITGKVVDSKGMAIPGATIMEKGTNNGAVTDANGNFKINVAGTSSVLVARFIGYNDTEVAVGTRANITITL